MTPQEQAEQVAQWLLQGQSTPDIRGSIPEHFPESDADALILSAIDVITQSANRTRATIHDWSIESMKFLYAQQVAIGDFAGAMRAVKLLLELAAPKTDPPERHEPQRIENQTNIIGLITNENFEQKRKELARIIEVCEDA